MKKFILSILIALSSFTAFSQTTAYTTIGICSEEYTEFSKEKNIYELKNTAHCNECKIMYNDYYIRMFQDGKETFTVDKSTYYKSSDAQYSTFYRNKYSEAFFQIAKDGSWIAFGLGDNKFIYNFCNK